MGGVSEKGQGRDVISRVYFSRAPLTSEVHFVIAPPRLDRLAHQGQERRLIGISAIFRNTIDHEPCWSAARPGDGDVDTLRARHVDGEESHEAIMINLMGALQQIEVLNGGGLSTEGSAGGAGPSDTRGSLPKGARPCASAEGSRPDGARG